MFNIREIADILIKNDLYLKSHHTEQTSLDSEYDLEYLEENVNDSEYSEINSYSFYLTWHRTANFTAFIDLSYRVDEEYKRYFELKLWHYSISCYDKYEFTQCYDYFDEIKEIVDKVNEQIKDIPVWKYEEEE